MWTNREKKSYLFISKNWENKSLERENKKNELNIYIYIYIKKISSSYT